MKIVNEFKDFVFRGNIIDLAVAVVLGTAFAAVVASLVADIITPIIGAIFGEPDFSSLNFTINNSVFTYGNFINALVTFVSVAAAIFFLIVKPVNAMKGRFAKPAGPATTRSCPECLSEVPIEAKRCAFCTSPIVAAA